MQPQRIPFTSFNKGAMPVLRKMIQMTERRNTLIANNIANAETPNYIAQDLNEGDFMKALASAVDTRREGNPRLWEFRGNRNVKSGGHGELLARTLPSAQGLDTMDHTQNNVDIDMEMAKLAQNSMTHSMMVELLSKQYQLIETAISERVA